MNLKKSFFILVIFVMAAIKVYPELNFQLSDSTDIKIDILFRSHLLNDQRIQWSGQETTFGAESMICSEIKKRVRGWTLTVESEILFTQKYGENILRDENRIKYHPNFLIETFKISRLNLQIEKGKVSFNIGKAKTPFGRIHFDIFTNDFNFGNPFIRTESILWRETGFFFTFRPGTFRIDLAIVNGEEDKDTNSSKAGILRIGLERKNITIGASIKAQDGIGSEQQKQYNNHLGMDFMFRFSSFTISGEFIYDQYGFHKYIHDDDIFWERSLYYRDVFYKHKTPVTGLGGYIDIGYEKSKFYASLNLGYYSPKEIEKPLHDDPNKRAILKVKYQILPQLDTLVLVMIENERTEESWRSGAKPYAFLIGFGYRI